MGTAPDRLRADLRRHYGLDLTHPDVGLLDLADLAANLPEDSRVWQAVNPAAEWTTHDWMTARIVDAIEYLAWTKTRDAARRGARWKPTLKRPGQRRRPHHAQEPSWTPAQVDAILAQPRTTARTP